MEDERRKTPMRSKKCIPAALALLGAVCLTATPTLADHYDAPRKFGRGLAGMTTSFLEVPGNMVLETDRRGAAVGLPLGFVKGLGMIVVRTPVGVYETVTAPFPAPDGYRPIIRPEYPWSYFDDDYRRAELDRDYDRTARRYDRYDH
jgi:putative exosortase-associated protein (TIGR04073 family)